jgi:cytochrome P450
MEAAVTEHARNIDELMSAGPMAPIEDVHSVYAQLRKDDPVHWMKAPLSSGVFVSRFADVHTVLKDDETFSSRSNGERGIALVMGRTLIGMDGREHLRHRALITPSLAPRALRGDFPKLVDRIAHDLIDGFAGKGAADLVAEFTFVYPLRVFTEILGLPTDDVRTFHNWAIDLSHVAKDPQRGLASSAKMKDYLAPVVADKRAHPSDDLISKVANAEVDGVRLTDEEVISFLRLLVIAGAETTYHLLGNALIALLRDPDLLELVRADRGRIAALLDETLRWESPVQIVTRETVEDTALSGVAIPSGTDVIVGIGSANRDEGRFPEAGRFDIDRQGEPHIAFGFGKHYCAGSRFALLEATVALDALLDRLPDLRADASTDPSRVVGIAFRSPDHLRVRFETGA